MSAPTVQDRSQPRIVALGVIATLVLFITGALVAGNATAETTSDRVWVCKYVGTPGVNEVLQAGSPIGVSVNALAVSPVVLGVPFADAQGRSFAIAYQLSPSDTYDGPACPEVPAGNGTPTETETGTPTETETGTPTETETGTPTETETGTPTETQTGTPTETETGTPTETETGTSTPTGTQPAKPGGPVAAPTDLPSTQVAGIAGLFGIALFLLGAAGFALRGTRQH